MKRMFCVILLVGLVTIFTTSLVWCQELDRKWFQVTFSAKGYDYSWPELMVGNSNSAKVVNYIQFVYNDIWSTACPRFYPFYELHVWYPTFAGWGRYVSKYIGPGETCYGMLCPYYPKSSADKQFVTVGHSDWLYFGGGGFTEGWANALTMLALKRKSGSVTSATLKSYGCVSDSSTTLGEILGQCTIKGKLIKPESLPAGIDPAGTGPYHTTPEPCTPP